MRQWNSRELDQREGRLVTIWLELIDERDTYHSPREDIANAVEDLIFSIETQNYGEFRQTIEKVESQADRISSRELRGATRNVERTVPNLEQIKKEREEIQTGLRQAVSIDTSPIFDMDCYIDTDELKSRIYSQISAQVDSILFQSIKDNNIIENLNIILSDLRSDKTRRRYNLEIVGHIEEFLRGNTKFSQDELKDVTQKVFGEVQSKSWLKDDFEKVIKRYVTTSEGYRDKNRDTLLKKLKGDMESRGAFVALPEARLEGLTPFSVGDVCFLSVSDDEFDLDTRKHVTHENVSISDQADVWATAGVSGATPQMLSRRLKQRVARALDVLNFGQKRGTIESPFDRSYLTYQEKSDGTILLLHRKTDLRDYPYSESVSKDRIDWKVGHFENYLTKSPESPLERSIANSVRWHRYAVQSPEDEEQFLKYIISIESLLVRGESETKADTIAERGPDILGLHTQYRQENREFFRNMYEVRSRVVHSGEREFPRFQEKLDELRKHSARLISIARGYTAECDSITEVVEQIKREEEDAKAERIEQSPFDLGDEFRLEARLCAGSGTSVAQLELDGEFKDDGRYVFFEADVGGEDHNGIGLNSDMDFSVEFKVNGQRYVGYPVSFVGTHIMEVGLSGPLDRIRWYQVDKKEDHKQGSSDRE